MLDPIVAERFDEAVAVLVAAFDEDPFFRYLAPQAAERALLVGEVMRSNLDVARSQGVARGEVTGSVDGVCLWFPPGTYPAPITATLGARLRAVGRALRPGRGAPRGLGDVIVRALRMSALLDEAHPAEPYGYLQVLGVSPHRQGQGVGGRMMRAALADADREGVVSFLETSKPANLTFYRRFGFEIVRATRLGGSPPVWTMRRAPARPGVP